MDRERARFLSLTWAVESFKMKSKRASEGPILALAIFFSIDIYICQEKYYILIHMSAFYLFISSGKGGADDR
jgi:hypothetical protein